ncbi:uncharacterized protein LOC132316394 [Cornus florida]|uniref:uncharacterized protein LOC132316394 n=1 Tax=Cornus florida TaxID=4283 RepID=UPI00289FF672|nr:uncharacterized protein LOC132316394 [Cornus florida]
MKFTAPQLMKQPLEQRDKSKHCAYHRDYRHSTNDCRSLRRQVENMIARGELVDYLMTKEYVKPREVNPRKVERTQVKVIHAIYGRSEDDQESEVIYRSRLRVAHKLRKISSVHAITSGSISIGFGDGDLSRVQLPHEDPLVISLLVANCIIKRVLIDSGSNANIITKIVFEQLEIPTSSIRPTSSPLMGFDGTRVDPLGVIDLSVIAAKRTLKENFVLTEIHPSYNLIMGRDWIYRMRGVPSTLHQVMRCLSLDRKEVINLWGDQVAAKECYMLTQAEAKKVFTQQQPEEEEEIAKPIEETLKAVEFILDGPQKVTYLGSSSTSEEKEALIDVIRSNTDAFAWHHSDMGHALRLKNAGATYQRLVNKIFDNLLGKTVEAYIDDMVIKSVKKEDHPKHLQEVFNTPKKYNIKLNPSKCSFAVLSGQFLGHIVNKRGIEVSPAQAKALVQNQEPKNRREVQVLTGRIAALSRFISRLSDKCKPFFDVIRSKNKDIWGPQQQEALNQLKGYMAKPPILSAPKPGEVLIMYLAISSIATSAALIREEGKRQHLVFYTSKTMTDAETRYSKADKIILALVYAKRKFRHYFESHSIVVLTNYPIQGILSKPDLSRRITKWAIELNSYDITYEPKVSHKGQIVADFLLEYEDTPEEPEPPEP